MVALMSVLACVLYVVPLGMLVALHHRESDDALDVACAIGVAFAADLLGGFVLTYLLRVETVAFVRTGLLLAAAGAIAARRWKGGLPPLRALGALTRNDLLALAAAAALAFAWSYHTSSEYWIWDREWHVPFTASLRAQKMPLRNVYDPSVPIRYHLAGDLAASWLQSLSFATISASRALSLAHDLQSAILAGIAALVFRSCCRWWPVTAVIAAVIPLLAGPMAFGANGVSEVLGAYEGDSDFNNLSLSFRPHCMIAGVVLLATLAQVVRLARQRGRQLPPAWSRVAALIPLVALCSITDEISTVLVGLSLAALWVGWPDLLGATRLRGFTLLAGLALVAVAANLLLAGTIAPGGPIEQASFVAPRLPMLAAPGRPLGADLEGWLILLRDTGSMIIPALVVGVLLLRERGKGDETALAALFVLAVAGLGLGMFLCFEVNERTYEGHRFATAGRFLVPVLALLYAAKPRRGAFAASLLLVPVLAGAFSTMGFVFYRLPEKLAAEVKDGQYDVNCRDEFGARLGEPILPTYVDQPFWYGYAGCRPVFTAGRDGPPGVVLCGFPMLGHEGLAKMAQHFFSPLEPVRLACAKSPSPNSPLCVKARTLGTCQDEGTLTSTCAIAPPARAALLRP